jgi:hypothetical protein
VLVAQRSVRVEQFQREPDGTWRYRVLGPGDVLMLANGATVAIDVVHGDAFELRADER